MFVYWLVINSSNSMAESEEIRSYRKQKFKERMAQKNKQIIHTENIYEKDNGNSKVICNQTRNQIQTQFVIQNENMNNSSSNTIMNDISKTNTAETISYKDKYNDLNSLLNYQSKAAIGRQAMIILFSVLHCSSFKSKMIYLPLVFAIESYQVFATVILLIEVTSLMILQDLRKKIKVRLLRYYY